jgi:hypothetical protein
MPSLFGENDVEPYFKCLKCNYTNFTECKKNFTKNYSACCPFKSRIVSLLFHRLQFDLGTSFIIVFKISTTTLRLFTKQIGKYLQLRRKTATTFMKKTSISTTGSALPPSTIPILLFNFSVIQNKS